MITLTPAYGRDYKSAAAAKVDLFAGKDFILNEWGSPWDGKPVNLEQIKAENSQVNIRYAHLTKVAVVKL